MKRRLKILFVIKKRGGYGGKISYGLKNSCELIKEAFKIYGIECVIRETIDGNTIDKEVHETKPTHVFIEAVWCHYDKIKELINLPRYKDIQWFVRLHSKVEFLAHEGMALNWLIEYDKIAKTHKNFNITFNNPQPVKDFRQALGIHSLYTPNLYFFKKKKHKPNYTNLLDIGCFGCLRELKNHLNQAFGALIFARKNRLKIRFHINNSSPYEKYGENILKNLTSLFRESSHDLVVHEWKNHDDFLELVNKMDICTQVSLSETCNITLIDAISQNVPSIGSSEIPYLNYFYTADPLDAEDIADKLEFAYYSSFFNLHRINEWSLNYYNDKSIQVWFDLLYKK